MGYRNLKAEMARENITIKNLMDVTGKSRAGISNNLNGRGRFSVDDSLAIRNAFFPKLSIDYLFENDDSENSENSEDKVS